MKKSTLLLFGAVLCCLLTSRRPAFAQGTAFTYQGRLNDGAQAANGSYDLTFSLYDAVANGAQIGASFTNGGTGVSNGLFTVVLDFGSNAFQGGRRWLEVAVRTNGAAGFSILSPRQELTPTPYAITAERLTGTVGSAGLSGTYGNVMMLTNPSNSFSGAFTGDGAGLTNINAVISTNVALKNAQNNFSGSNYMTILKALNSISTNIVATNSVLTLGATSEDLSDFNRISFVDKTNFQERASISLFRSAYHDDELVLQSMHDLAFVGDFSGSGHSRFQFGGVYYNENMYFPPGVVATSGTTSGHGKTFVLGGSYWNGSAAVGVFPGFQVEPIDNAGNVEIAFYGHILGNQNFDFGNMKAGGIGTNNAHFQKLIATNTIGAGAAAFTGHNADLTKPLVDVSSGFLPGLVVGADTLATTRTANSNKLGYISFVSKDGGAATPFGLFRTDGGIYLTSGNILDIGGGSGGQGFIDGWELIAGSAGGVTLAGNSAGNYSRVPFVLPSYAKASRPTPATGMMIFQSDNTPGLRVYNGTHWVKYSESNDD